MAKRMGAVEWGMLLGLAALWGGTFFFVEVALTEMPFAMIVASRVVIAALALNLFLFATGRRMPLSFDLWRSFLAMAILNNVIPFSLIFWGQTQIAGGLAAILNAATPLFTVLLADRLTPDERLTPARLVAVLLGLVGVVVMIGPDAVRGLGTLVLAQLAVLGAALSYALAGIYGRRFQGQDPTVTACGQLTGSSAVMVGFGLLAGGLWPATMPSLPVIGAVLALALFSTALAYILYFAILARAGASNLLLVTFLIPVTAILLGAAFLSESLDTGHYVGMAIIGLSLAILDGRLLAAIRVRTASPSPPGGVRGA